MRAAILTRWWRGFGFLLLAVFTLGSFAYGQFELPDEIFQRTLLIRYEGHQATGFKFDQDGRVYVVTTGRFAKLLPKTAATIQLWHQEVWNDFPTLRTLFPATKDVDLAVLETSERVRAPYKVIKSSETLTTGQRVWIMGKRGPIRLPTLPANVPKTQRPMFPDIPWVKLGIVTDIRPAQPDAYTITFQGYSDPQLGGGPIVYWSPVHRDYEILGVIKGGDPNATPPPNAARAVAESPKTSVLHGYSIDYVTDTIRDSGQP